MRGRLLWLAVAMIAPGYVYAQASPDVAQQLQNPIADLTSVPFEGNWDFRLGPKEEGTRYTLNLQPVIPFKLSSDWTMISRTILPYISQDADTVSGAGSLSGFGDVTQSFFFVPRSTAGGWMWGVGPAILIPTATEDAFGGNDWGLGPTGVVVKYHGPWTYGALANHIWSVSWNKDDHTDINRTFLQPFISHTNASGMSLGANFEATYDWKLHEATVPLNLTVSQLVKLGSQTINLTAGVRYYFNAPNDGPDWGIRLAVAFVFPK